MAITADAPRGGVVEEIDGVTYIFLVRNCEIERFQGKHRGIFEVCDGFFERGVKPTSKEVKDLIALALVGGGMKDPAADRLVETVGPANLMRFYQIAQVCLGAAFMPDVLEDNAVKKNWARAKTQQS